MERTLEEIFPPFSLHLRCGEVELVGTRPEHVRPLAEVARRGVFEGPLPFLFDWPHLPDQDLNMHQHCWGSWAQFTPQRWHLKLTVVQGGQVLGCQDVMNADDFLVTQVLKTGSWLGLEHQGKGIGTRIRQMVAMFCFDHLGAEVLQSGYIVGNRRSEGVSRRVGYRPNGTRRLPEGTSWREEALVRLVPADLVRPDEPLQVTGVEAFRAFIGL